MIHSGLSWAIAGWPCVRCEAGDGLAGGKSGLRWATRLVTPGGCETRLAIMVFHDHSLRRGSQLRKVPQKIDRR